MAVKMLCTIEISDVECEQRDKGLVVNCSLY